MKGSERRNQILSMMQSQSAPLSGTQLAEQLQVSRQVIVQDIALLRSAGHEILSTHRGYVMLQSQPVLSRVVKVSHTDAQIEDELNTIVDLGGTVSDVFISHRAYGRMQAQLNIRSRRDVALFLHSLATGKSSPLKNITSNYHYHTITAESGETLELIFQALQQKGYLVSIDDWDWQYVAPQEG